MKELTIEQKAKAYDEAIRKAKITLDCCDSTSIATKNTVYDIFPELKESEDERIRKNLLEWFEEFPDMIWRGHYKKDVIAWLEKYGNKVKPKFHPGDWVVHNKANFVFKVISVSSNSYGVVNRENHKKTISFNNENKYHIWTIQDAKDGDVLYSTGFHGDCIFIFNGIDKWRFDEPNGDRAVATGYCCLTLSADNMEFDIQGPGCIEVDTVKPSTKEQYDLLFRKMKEASYEWNSVTKELKRINKFKVGDWIVFNGFILYIKEVVKGFYITISIGGITNRYDWDIDNIARLWTIQDAKAGDILVSSITKNPFVYNRNYTSESIGAYFGLTYNSKLLICDSFPNSWTALTGVQPATEEQRDMLFKKLHDSDYKWDSEKKELWHKYL